MWADAERITDKPVTVIHRAPLGSHERFIGLNAKIRTAGTRKIPLIIVVGRSEAEQHTVSVRYHFGEESSMTVDAFVDHALDLVRSKSLEGAGHLLSSRDAGAGES